MIAVNGCGLDEITICGRTKAFELKNGNIGSYEINPEEHGFKLSALNEIRGSSIQENAGIIKEVLNGRKGAKRDVVLLNAAAALLASDKAKDFKDALELAANSIDSGKALDKLKNLINFTNENARQNN